MNVLSASELDTEMSLLCPLEVLFSYMYFMMEKSIRNLTIKIILGLLYCIFYKVKHSWI